MTDAGGAPWPVWREPSPKMTSHETSSAGIDVVSVNFTASGCLPDDGDAEIERIGAVPPPTVICATV